ncbi:spore germination protein [Bacillus paramycoides]|uniref:spore germination protein n=1 Tax=Bacillus paramycoides TaxID=2026194 RepID=UPI002E1C1795|nr:spore germination protein [Bacillus paramycoides]
MNFMKKMFKLGLKHSVVQECSDFENVQKKEPLKINLQENLKKIKETLGYSTDLIIREISIGNREKVSIGILYIDGLSDTDSIQNFIMESLMLDINNLKMEDVISTGNGILELLEQSILTIGNVKKIEHFEDLNTYLLSGNTILLIDGYVQGLKASTSGWENRGVQEPTSQTLIRGPKDGFSENLRTNTALIRRKIKSPNLWLETITLGSETQTDVSIMYIKGIVNDKTVEDVKQRLELIDIDGILESGYIEELIQDKTYTPFPTIYNTERPDVVAAGLLEGRIAILVDGTPFVLLVPAIFIQFIHSAEDYYQRSDFGIIRMVRLLAFFLALLAPSLYIALTTFHQEMIPTALLISVAAQREGVPFPAFIEALIMEITFEILREAGVRMPRAVGQAVSIVGALVIGQAAVEAGIVSAAMVIVVAITAISNFAIPSYNLGIAIRISRFGFIVLAAGFGLFGIILGIFTLILHLCSLHSFGIPYMAPLAPFNATDQKDTIFRFPIWKMKNRPKLLNQKNMKRKSNISRDQLNKKWNN